MDMPEMNVYRQFHENWALVAAGTMERHNAMTVSWGGLGSLWGKPVATVYVRPNRFTYGFLEEQDFFTVSFYPAEYKKALAVMGSKSGRDCDKDTEAGLMAVAIGGSVTYQEAKLTLLCRKLYAQDMDASKFPEDVRERFYGTEPAHRMYIGEIIEILE